MAVERQIPGDVEVNETETAERQVPGGAFINETAGDVLMAQACL